MDIITTHLNADFDSLASMVAAKKYYPDAFIVFPGAQEKAVRNFLASSHIDLDLKRVKDIDMDKIRRLILVDVKSPTRIGEFSKILKRKNVTVHIYDHHPFGKDDIKAKKKVIEKVGSTATIFTEMIQKDKKNLSPQEATIMMIGIYEETGSLSFPSTTARDITAAAYLLKKGGNLNIVSSFISRELGPEEVDLLNELIHSSKEHVIHGIRVMIASACRDSYLGDIAFLANKIRDMNDIDSIFLLVLMEERLQIIGRSHSPELDVAEVLHEFGGGGHPQAASAVVRNIPIEESIEKLLDVLKSKIHPVKTAKDIMTSPVITIPSNRTIKTAEKTMTKYGINVLPVLKQRSYYGIISREVVEKALFHGFGKSSVAEFCTTDTPTVTPTSSIKTVESQMIEKNQRFMPVVEDNKITGAITRTDILRSIYENLLRKERILSKEKITGKPSVGKNLSSALKLNYSKEIYNLLKLSGEIAEKQGFTAYLVGGSVRDLIQGIPNPDIDIVIEGDGIRFARALGKELNLRVRIHKRFGTAVVITEFLKFDVATARTEHYESPAALPTVETSSIKKDLYRRDFTINTLALNLNPGRFGHLIDFFGGQRDIKDKTIRILHNLSFIEDPTRAFRAIRFSERFGFKVSKHTLNLIKSAVKINLFNKLSGTRMYDELNLLLLETEPVKALKRLEELDLLKFIHPRLKMTKALEKVFVEIEEAYSWFKLLFIDEKLNKADLFIMALIEDLPLDERKQLLKRLYVPPKVKKEMLDGINASAVCLKSLRQAGGSQRKIYYTLLPLSLQTVLYAMARAKSEEQKKAISLYLTSLRNIKPEIAGKDLRSLGYSPGPIYRKILAALLDARLDGKIKSREEEIDFVKEQFRLKPGKP